MISLQGLEKVQVTIQNAIINVARINSNKIKMYKPIKELQQFSSRLYRFDTANKYADWTKCEAAAWLLW